MNIVLWILQVLLGVLFVWAGGFKLVVPIATMTSQMPTPMPGWFLRFIGVAELLGGLGLLVPGLLRMRPGLTPLAAAGLVIIMAGATAMTLAAGAVGPAMFPLVVGLLLVFVAYGRWRLRPVHDKVRPGSWRRPSRLDATRDNA